MRSSRQTRKYRDSSEDDFSDSPTPRRSERQQAMTDSGKYKIIFAGLSEQAIADRSTFRWSNDTKTTIVKHAVQNYCGFALPPPRILLDLCIDIGLPLDRGADLAQVCIEKLISWIKTNLNSHLVSDGASMFTNNTVRQKTYVAQALVDAAQNKKFSIEWVKNGRVGKMHAELNHRYKAIKNTLGIGPAQLTREVISYAVDHAAISEAGKNGKKDDKAARQTKKTMDRLSLSSSVLVSESDESSSIEEESSEEEPIIEKAKKTKKKQHVGESTKLQYAKVRSAKAKLVVDDSSEESSEDESSEEEATVKKVKKGKKKQQQQAAKRAKVKAVKVPVDSSSEDSSSDEEPLIKTTKKNKRKLPAGGRVKVRSTKAMARVDSSSDDSSSDEEPLIKTNKKNKKKQPANECVKKKSVQAKCCKSVVEDHLSNTSSDIDMMSKKEKKNLRAADGDADVPVKMEFGFKPEMLVPGEQIGAGPTASYYENGRPSIAAMTGALDPEVAKTDLLAAYAGFSAVASMRSVGIPESSIQDIIHKKIAEQCVVITPTAAAHIAAGVTGAAGAAGTAGVDAAAGVAGTAGADAAAGVGPGEDAAATDGVDD